VGLEPTFSTFERAKTVHALGLRPRGHCASLIIIIIIIIIVNLERSYEFGIEPSGFIKCWETIEWLTTGGL
jgi:hypothetical protein